MSPTPTARKSLFDSQCQFLWIERLTDSQPRGRDAIFLMVRTIRTPERKASPNRSRIFRRNAVAKSRKFRPFICSTTNKDHFVDLDWIAVTLRFCTKLSVMSSSTNNVGQRITSSLHLLHETHSFSIVSRRSRLLPPEGTITAFWSICAFTRSNTSYGNLPMPIWQRSPPSTTLPRAYWSAFDPGGVKRTLQFSLGNRHKLGLMKVKLKDT